MRDRGAARATTLTALAAAATLAAPAGAAAQAGVAGAAASDSATAERLQRMAERMTHVTNHLEQMSKTLRDNPELEERWTDPAAFDRMIRLGALVEALTHQASALGRELRRTAGADTSAGSRALAETEAAMRRRMAELVPALGALVEAAAGLSDAAHEGEGGGHEH